MERLKNKDLIKKIFDRGIVGTNFLKPITFKSRIRSWIYCDWRKACGHPDLMDDIKEGLAEIVRTAPITADAVFGVATGAIPHATLLAQHLKLPFGYVRPDAKAKNYGLGKRVEGTDVKGKVVLLVEDLNSTATSMIENAAILKEEGAAEVILLSIFTYNLAEANANIENSGLRYYSLLSINDLLPYLKEQLDVDQFVSATDWIQDPRAWFDKYKTTFNFGFLTTLRKSAKQAGNIACMGLDPVLESLPNEFSSQGVRGIYSFYKVLFEAMRTANLSPAMFKPNEGFFSSLNNGFEGSFVGDETLSKVNALVRDIFFGIPLNIDAKRGDIGKSSDNYAKEYYCGWKTEAMTIHTYMGKDSVMPFVKYCSAEKCCGVYALDRTSNPGGNDFQTLLIGNEPLHSIVGGKIIEWGTGAYGLGAVVGATSIEELSFLAKKFAGKDVPLLVPGVGDQGGKAPDVMHALHMAKYEIELARINSSSKLTHPWGTNEAPSNWLELCLNNIKQLCHETNIAA